MNPVSFATSMRYNARLAQKPRFGKNDASNQPSSTDAATQSLHHLLAAQGYSLQGLLTTLSIFAGKLINPTDLTPEETLKLADSLEDGADVLKKQAELIREMGEAHQSLKQ